MTLSGWQYWTIHKRNNRITVVSYKWISITILVYDCCISRYVFLEFEYHMTIGHDLHLGANNHVLRVVCVKVAPCDGLVQVWLGLSGIQREGVSVLNLSQMFFRNLDISVTNEAYVPKMCVFHRGVASRQPFKPFSVLCCAWRWGWPVRCGYTLFVKRRVWRKITVLGNSAEWHAVSCCFMAAQWVWYIAVVWDCCVISFCLSWSRALPWAASGRKYYHFASVSISCYR